MLCRYVLTLAILFGGVSQLNAGELYCLYWPVYVDGSQTLYAADMIDDSDPNACEDAIPCYYWSDTNDPSVPEDCPNCSHSAFLLRSEEYSGVSREKSRNSLSGLQKRIPANQEFAALVPAIWMHHDARIGRDVSWKPQQGIVCKNTRIVTVVTESGKKISVKLFDVEFNPEKADLSAAILKSKERKIGFEIAGNPSASAAVYKAKKIPKLNSVEQGKILVEGAEYTIMTYSPLFRDNVSGSAKLSKP